MRGPELFPLYRLYHKNQRDLVDPDAVDQSTGSDDWTTGGYKEFSRLEPERPPSSFDPDDDEFVRALRARESFSAATTARPVSRRELFTVLSCAYHVDGETGTRPVASAGQLYPLEIYPLVLDSPDIDAGLYHYNPADNTLERPADPSYLDAQFGPFEQFLAENWTHLDPEHEISAIFLITGIPSRSAAKYGERGYLFTLLEAGAVIHAMQLAAMHLDIGSRPYAGFRYDAVAELLGLANDDSEWVLASLALAHPG